MTEVRVRPMPDSAPETDNEHLNTRVVWSYYIGNMTQQQIADRFGLTRMRVNKIVGQARTSGAVHIELRMPLASCVALEAEVKARYDLADVTIVPAVAEEDQQRRVIAEAASEVVQGLLRDGQTIGIGWGRTLSLALRRLRPQAMTRSRVLSLMGGMAQGSDANMFDLATSLATTLGTRCRYLPSLLYYPDEDTFSSLLAHPPIADVLDEARRADLALLSCGDLSPRSQLFSGAQVKLEEIAGLKEAGAVGDILGTFLDADGAAVDHSLNRRVMALRPIELSSLPNVVLASGGVFKLPIIRALLRAGYVDRLVTDEQVANQLVAA